MFFYHKFLKTSVGKIDPVQDGSGLRLLREDSNKLIRVEKSFEIPPLKML